MGRGDTEYFLSNRRECVANIKQQSCVYSVEINVNQTETGT